MPNSESNRKSPWMLQSETLKSIHCPLRKRSSALSHAGTICKRLRSRSKSALTMALRRAAGSSLLNKLLAPISSASATRSYSTTSTPVTTHDSENPDGFFSADPDTKNVELKIRISKVERRGYHPNELPPHTSRVRLPTTRTIYTVLRSPHIDKKSREQFQMKVRKDLLVIKTDKTELRNKYFWLKRQRIFGAQYEVQVCCKTRLDKEKLKALL